MKCQRCGKKKREKCENFTIYVSVIEGRHFAWPNMDSFVLVNLANYTKCTKICKQTDSPYFNEYFVFDFFTTLEKILDTNITLTVIQPRTCCRKKKILGSFRLDVGTIWSHSDRQFYHKWAIISSDDVKSGPKGYLKVDLGIKTKNQVPRIPLLSAEQTDVIEGNLLLPEGVAIERQKAQYIFKIHKGKGFLNCTDRVYIEIIFAGHKAKTSTIYYTGQVCEWNERIIFTELFPPLCQRFVINLVYKSRCSSVVQSTRYITLASISNNGPDGYLPTFGPMYLYFYCREEHGFGYTGSLLLSMNTRVEGETDMPGFKGKKVAIEASEGITETRLWNKEEVRLYGIIFDVTLVDKKFSNQTIKFELSFGETSDKNDRYEVNQYTQQTKAVKPKCTNKYFCCLEHANDKPCMLVTQELPDFRRRMFNANMIKKITDNLKLKIEELQAMFDVQEFFRDSSEIEQKLLEVISYIQTTCEKYVNYSMPINVDEYTNTLDKERSKYCLQEIKAVLKVLPIVYDQKRHMKSFRRIQKIFRKIEPLSENAQDAWPDVFISVYTANRHLAYKQIPAKDILYSRHYSERGIHCGTIQTIFFEPPSNLIEIFESRLACKIDILLWVGLQTERSHFYNLIPNGYSYAGDGVSTIHSDQKYVFQCRAHVYQGKISPGYDQSGLADTFVRIIIGKHCCQTSIQPDTLNPLWDQTMVLRNIIIYGSREFIKQNPPVTVIEVYDQDLCFKVEFVGRTTIIPRVKTAEDPYSFPLFPVPLQWKTIINTMGEKTGEILLCVELLEVTGEQEGIEETEIIPIPSDIRPHTALYKIEVLLWGVRDLKKVNLLGITKPKINVSCYQEGVDSDVLDVKEGLNFANSCLSFEVMLPDNQDFVPPIVIKMFDSRALGRTVYVGNNLEHLSSFITTPVPKLEWQQIMSGIVSKSLELYDPSQLSSILFSKMAIEQKLVLKPIKERSLAKLKKVGFFKRLFGRNKKKKSKISSVYDEENYNIDEEEEYNDWWLKYYLSTEGKEVEKEYVEEALQSKSKTESVQMQAETTGDIEKRLKVDNSKYTLKIYNRELELQTEFSAFTDVLMNFPIYKGKRSGDETVDKEKITGIFKGNIKVYKSQNKNSMVEYVTTSGLDLQKGYFQDAPSNENLNFIMRVYCVKGVDLKPKDLSGKSDPYIYLKMGTQQINDRDNYIAKQLSPTFGKYVKEYHKNTTSES